MNMESLTVSASYDAASFDEALTWIVQAVEQLNIDAPTIAIDHYVVISDDEDLNGNIHFGCSVSGAPVRDVKVTAEMNTAQ